MRFSLGNIVSIGLLARLGQCVPSRPTTLEPRGPGACFTPSNRACWSPGFDINTDYETKTPPGVVRTFNWEVTEHDNWTGPDGRIKSKVMLVNNQYPGPTLKADWGDTVVVNIKNSLRINGTSFHWHGIRQLGTNIMDGTNGVTECPVPPGASKTYTFRFTQYGTTWYHSHFSGQYGNGVFGPIVINGPASLPYDIDLGAYPINDYYLKTADELIVETQHTPAPPKSDNVLFNGTNINPAGSGGAYSRITVTPGKRHLLRLINTSVENNFQVSIVGHDMTVVATDLVPVNSFTTNNVFLGIGQRVDVTIDASKTPGNYWMNVTMPASSRCGLSLNPAPAAIVHYANAPVANPTTPGIPPPDAQCSDSLSYVPVVSRQAPLNQFTPGPKNTLDINFQTSPLVFWTINNTSINVDWDRPVLDYVLKGNTSYPASENVVIVDQKDVWTFWVLENIPNVPHPIHLHGHDFLVLGTGAGSFTAADKASLRGANPVRRDVTMLPGQGWLVLAFKADNPGNWIMHCHIAWHVSGGMAVDFLERVPEQKAQVSAADSTAFQDNCARWRGYFDNSGIVKIDSGL
ncbi:multicopper oxidase-domain-containing protein [Xylaria bambusicola]|uniref:multicopper oxidase-domain-containing protein n=1 Tax=Xylaria bambusicola TaxID=326684 RepID=UPI002007516F|nr:multicopper oxidase-domain-containing protein [Xylaria bambusicola]KAI0503422.1 multicopper oxidase-domain-containing protein [Xylaria bambusicola]